MLSLRAPSAEEAEAAGATLLEVARLPRAVVLLSAVLLLISSSPLIDDTPRAATCLSRQQRLARHRHDTDATTAIGSHTEQRLTATVVWRITAALQLTTNAPSSYRRRFNTDP